MATFLLAWNPKRWYWENLTELAEKVKGGSPIIERWSCGKTKRIQRGDRVFLIRLGQEPRGIMASGRVIRGSYEAEHWDADRAKAGEKALFVDVKVEVLLDPEQDNILPREYLNQQPFLSMHWDTQMSGIRIPDEIATGLEKLWASFVSIKSFSLPEEVSVTENVYEGAVRKVFVNAYERSPEARRKCIAYYGVSCSVCDFNFASTYGNIGKGFIHVHHLQPLSSIGKKYKVDPIRDLRPVCPNCHAIIHMREPAYTIEEVKTLLKKAQLSENQQD